MTAPEVVRQASTRGVNLRVADGRLKYESALPVPADFVEMLREHKTGLIAYLLEQPPEPPKRKEPLTLDEEAAAILAELRPGEALTPTHWLALAEAARLEAVATFPAEKRDTALKSYVVNFCKGRPAELIAAHTVALKLWARRRPSVPIGHCQDAACNALELEADSLILNTPIPKRGKK